MTSWQGHRQKFFSREGTSLTWSAGRAGRRGGVSYCVYMLWEKKKILETVGFPCDTTVAGCSFDEVRSLYVIFNVIDILEQVNF